jgi:hypothetical protein
LCARRVAQARACAGVTDCTTRPARRHGTKAARAEQVRGKRTDEGENVNDTPNHDDTDAARAPACRSSAHTARLVVAVASVVGGVTVAQRRRGRSVDRPCGPRDGLMSREDRTMVLHSRPISKAANAAMAAAAAAAPQAQKTVAAKSVTAPRILQSAHSPAQLCFFFKRG